MNAPITPIRYALCKTCDGTGDCQTCGGDGKDDTGLVQYNDDCDTCGDTGDCQDCGGRGELEVTS